MNNKNQEMYFTQEVLERIIKAFFSDNFENNVKLIPFNMRPKGFNVYYRCCIYKERAILRDRIIAGLGFSIEDDNDIVELSYYTTKALERTKPNENALTVVEKACKGCVPSRVYVTDLCQGCLANSCKNACKFDAISITNGRSRIDSIKCKNCKMCVSACPYNAIVKIAVPCEDSCPVNAIKKNEHGTAEIDYSTCISCGKCIMSCPFGAVCEKSQVIDILKNIKEGKKVVALIAPSIAGQFEGSIYQLKFAIKQAGFYDVYEVASGADITIKNEAKEFKEHIKHGMSFMTTSCCSGYNRFISKHLPAIKSFVSQTQTPLYYTSEKVKLELHDAITVFLSPCIAKKGEAYENKNVDYVLNYQELAALLKVKDIKVKDCQSENFDIESSKQARNFGVTGGVVGAVAKALEKKDVVKPYIINGLNKEVITYLKKIVKEKQCQEGNLIEIMCCQGGCICGNATISSPATANKRLKILLDQSQDIS
ncbi:MAG: monomeric [FeFe] hydrogenase [Endomicrobium sp.]|jgi:[FeFe] hydrogenase (group B1/B3)|nr:monomeric [FeFe] hydrogenase [Endomicrobium sp.]